MSVRKAVVVGAAVIAVNMRGRLAKKGKTGMASYNQQADKFAWKQDRCSNKQYKRAKSRLERRKAKRDPACQETYHKFRGWTT